MKINNGFNILPWYDSLEKQHQKKWYAYGQSWPLLCPQGTILPFQFISDTAISISSNIYAINTETGSSFDLGVKPVVTEITYAESTYYIVKLTASDSKNIPVGKYSLRMATSEGYLYSEEITIIDNAIDCIKVEYWNEDTLRFTAGEINFDDNFRFIFYINSTIGKPEYEFEEELTKRLGYKFIESQTSNKIYKFSFVAPEYICDAMRLIRMCDFIKLTTKYDSYNALSLSYEPKWQEQGDLASIDVEFETDCIIQKLESFNRGIKESFYNALLSNIEEPILFSSDTVAQYYTEYTSVSYINGKLIRQLEAISEKEIEEELENLVLPIDNQANEEDSKAKKIFLHDILKQSDSGFDKLFKGHYDESGKLLWIEALAHLGINGGLTMFIDTSSLDLPSIYDGLPIDNDTIYWEEVKNEDGSVTRILKVKGGSGGGGLGFITLSNDDVLSEKLTEQNAVYEVRGDFDLEGGILPIPENCTLYFNGGSFSNGTIEGSNTQIAGEGNYNFFNDCTVKGFNTGFFDVRWFGGVPDYDTASNSGTDNAIFFDRAIKACGLNTGAYVRVIGKYLIGSTITVKHDLVMQGDYHPNRTFRAESGVEEEGCNSLIFVKSGVIAFLVVGRGDSGMRSSQLFINNIKFVGGDIGSSVLIEYTATGAPTRVGKFAECVCTKFRRVLYFHDKDGGSEGTIYGNLTIEKVFAYYNNQFLVATVSDATVATRPSFMSLCNLMIKDSTIEQNGSNAIYLERLFGPTVINNCLLEATPNAIYATVIAGSLEITNNYFEQQGGSYMIHVEGMNVNNCFFTYTGNYRVNADKGKGFEISGFTVVDFNTSGYQRSDVKFEGCIVEKNLWRKVNVSGIGSHSRFTDIKYYKVYPYDDFAFPMSFGTNKLKGGMLGLIGHVGTKSRVARTKCPVVSGDNLLLCYYFDGASQHEVYLCNDAGAVIASEKPVIYGGAEGIQFYKFKINSATSYINVYMDCSSQICIGNGFIFKNVPDDMCLDELGIMFPNYSSGDTNVAYKTAESLRGMTLTSEGTYDGLYYSDGENIRNSDGTVFTKAKIISKYVHGWTFTDKNTVYRIVGDVDMGSNSATMPEGCTLDFSAGGSITGKLTLNTTRLLPLGLNPSSFLKSGTYGTVAEGQVRYNSSNKRMELYNGSSWVNLDGTSFT